MSIIYYFALVIVSDRPTVGSLSFLCNVKVLSKTCTNGLECLVIKCRPYYLPREFTSIVFTVVYIPPEANPGVALKQLSDIITQHENAHPGAIAIVADFNECNLKRKLPKFHQHISCATRNNATLDHCYSTIKGAYRSLKRPPLGKSDHNMVHLVPAYRQQLKRDKITVRSVSQWSVEATERLRGCCVCTDWDLFLNESTDLDECAEVTLDYIKFCEDLCIPKKVVKRYPNEKSWFCSSVRQQLKAKHEAFKSGDPDVIKRSKYDLRCTIKRAKHQ